MNSLSSTRNDSSTPCRQKVNIGGDTPGCSISCLDDLKQEIRYSEIFSRTDPAIGNGITGT